MANFLEHHYSRPTTPAGAGFDYTILDGVEIQNERGFSASATLGDADICQVVVDDPNAEWDFAGHRRWYLAETAIGSNQLVWTGYIGEQRITRRASDTGSKIVGTGRVWELDLVELNAIASFRIVTGTDGNRPAETAGARLTWLLASDYLSTVHDNGLVVYPTNPMDAVDYRGQTAADVLRDCSLASGYNWFVYYDEPQPAGEEVSLFFDDPSTSTAYTSFIRISNVLADVEAAENNTFAPSSDASLLRDPTDVAAGIYLPYDGGALYDYDYNTSFEFGFRDKAAPSANVKTEAKAQAIINRLLVQHSEQDEKIGVTIQLPASQLNDVKHGHRMQVKFTHLPGYEDWTWMRVVSKAFSRPANGATDRYDVDLELVTALNTDTPAVVDPIGVYSWFGGAGGPFDTGRVDWAGTTIRNIYDGSSSTENVFNNAIWGTLADFGEAVSVKTIVIRGRIEWTNGTWTVQGANAVSHYPAPWADLVQMTSPTSYYSSSSPALTSSYATVTIDLGSAQGPRRYWAVGLNHEAFMWWSSVEFRDGSGNALVPTADP